MVTLDSFRSSYDDKLISLYKIAEQRPKMFQDAVKSLLATAPFNQDKSAD